MTLVAERGSLFVDLTRDRADFYGERHDWLVCGEDKVRRMIEAAVECLKNDLPFPVTAHDGYAASRVALRAYRNLWGPEVEG